MSVKNQGNCVAYTRGFHMVWIDAPKPQHVGAKNGTANERSETTCLRLDRSLAYPLSVGWAERGL
jgi:hypothetical protein